MVQLIDTTIQHRHLYSTRLLVIVRVNYRTQALEYIAAAERVLGEDYWNHFDTFADVVIDFMSWLGR